MPSGIGIAPAEDENSQQTIGQYKIQKTIGQGSYGKVKLAVHTKTKEKVAIKVIKKQNITNIRQATRLKREIRFLKLLSHPNIVKVYDVFETQNSIYIIMELAKGGELFDYIVAHKRLKDKEARHFFRQIISAVDYCHRNSVIHRDLKPENLLLDENKNIKIIDFGFSNTFKSKELLETFCGSPFYAAPEMILGQRYEGPEVDLWSMGVILFTLLCGHLPFDDPNPKILYEKILSGYFVIPDYVSPDAKHLLSRLICVDSAKRARLDEVRCHPWVNEGYSELPNTHFPLRNWLNPRQLNPDLLAKLQGFGFSIPEIKAAFEDDITQNNPIVNTYHLMQERLSEINAIRSSKNCLAVIPEQKEKEKEKEKEDVEMGNNNMTSSANNANNKIFPQPPPQQRKASLNDNNRHHHTASASTAMTNGPGNTVQQVNTAPNTPNSNGNHKRRFSLPILDALTGQNQNNQNSNNNCQNGNNDCYNGIREINSWFFSVATTSRLPPDTILAEILKALTSLGLAFQAEGPYTMRISYSSVKSTVTFDAEVCRIPKLALYGVNFKRVSGSFWTYKKVCNKILSLMSL